MVGGGTLTNAEDGTIQVMTGSGGPRSLNGNFTNYGNATIILDGPTSRIINNQSNLNALLNFAINDMAGSFTLQDSRTFTTGGDFANNGILAVDSTSTFIVATNHALTNCSNGTLSGGTYQIAGVFQFAGAAIATNAATLLLDGTAFQIIDQNRHEGLASALATNAAGASLTLQNSANLTTASAFENHGSLTIGPGSTPTITGADTDTGTLAILASGMLILQSAGSSGTISNVGGLLIDAGTTFTSSGDYNQSGLLTVSDITHAQGCAGNRPWPDSFPARLHFQKHLRVVSGMVTNVPPNGSRIVLDYGTQATAFATVYAGLAGRTGRDSSAARPCSL